MSTNRLSAQTGDVRNIHDPTIVRDGDTFYCFSTDAGIAIHTSPDLIHWSLAGRVFDHKLDWWLRINPKVGHLWAPDLAKLNGRWHLYYCVSNFGRNDSAIGLATLPTLDPKSPDYAWKDEGIVVESVPGRDDWNAIDPNITFDLQGKPWLAWGSFWGGLQLQRLDPKTGKLLADSPRTVIAARPGNAAIEAPFIHAHGGHYFLFVSYDQCCKGVKSTYHIRVGRSTSITGPYVDREGKPMLEGHATVVLQSENPAFGPGHCMVLADTGKTYLVHHYYDGRAKGARTLQIRELTWDAQGWPVAGEPLK